MKVVLCLILLCIIELSCVLASPISEDDVRTIDLAQHTDSINHKESISTYYIPTPGIGTHKYHNQRKSWNDARITCLNEGGHLGVINSADEEKIFLKYMNVTGELRFDQIWVGIHELFKKDDWVSVKDERLDAIGYVHWLNGQPDGTPDEHCLTITQGGLNDFICGEPLPFVCEL